MLGYGFDGGQKSCKGVIMVFMVSDGVGKELELGILMCHEVDE